MQPAGGVPNAAWSPPPQPYGSPPVMWNAPPGLTVGPPNRQLFTIGAAGHFIVVAAVLLAPFSGLHPFFYYFGSGSGPARIFLIASAVLLTVALLLQLVGFFGFWRNHRNVMGAVCFGFGIAPAIMPLLSVALSFGGFSFGSFLLFFIEIALLGILFVLEGTAYLLARNSTSTPGLCVATGTLFIVGGSFVCTFFLTFVGDFLLVAPLVMGGIIMAQASRPSVRDATVPGLSIIPPQVP